MDDTFFPEDAALEDNLPDMLAELESTEEAAATPAAPDPFEASTITLTIRYLPAKDKGGREVVISAQQEGGLGLVDLARSTSYAFLPEAAYEALHKLKARLTVATVAKQLEVNVQTPAAKPVAKTPVKKTEATKPLSLFD